MSADHAGGGAGGASGGGAGGASGGASGDGGESSPGAASSAGGRHRRALAWVLALVLGFVGIEVAAGLMSGSLTLLADAGHMATDALGVGMALAAVTAASRAPRRRDLTFGRYRWEVLAALANSGLLLGVAAYVGVEAVGRLADPHDVDAVPMLVVGAAGLAVNIVSFRLLHAGSRESLNVRGAYLEVIADMIGSLGVLASALVVATTGWVYTDTLVALALAAFIVPRALRLGRDAIRIVVQAAPAHVDVDAVRAALASIDSVTDVHDVHVWTLTSGMDVATAHVVSDSPTGTRVAQRARLVLADYGLAHATVQVEHADGTADTGGTQCGPAW